MQTFEASVIKNAGSHFLLSRLPVWEPFPAVLRGKVRLKGSSSTNPVAVGDRVIYSGECGTEGFTLENPAVIKEVLPRRNYLIRKSINLSRQSHVIAANLDAVYVVVSLYFPEAKLPFIDRLLLTCEVYGIPAVIVLNKTDLYRDEAPEYLQEFKRTYEGAGYRVIETSVPQGLGIEELKASLKGRLALFTGESGVGKSSLIRSVDPTLDPKIGRISSAHLQGKHTTSLYEMYRASIGPDEYTYIIDSPGLRGFGLVDLKPTEIALYFPEMLREAKGCRFTPCTHTHEPGCMVKEAVEEGRISPWRYNSYLGMLEEDDKFR